MATERLTSFGQRAAPSWADRLGQALSRRQFTRFVDVSGRRVADLGCGYHAPLSRAWHARAAHTILVDLRVSPELKGDRVDIVEGALPRAAHAIADASLDVVYFNNVLEHLREPETMLREIHRVLAPGGIALVNVPSWRGKYWLELLAFRFGWSPAEEMEDHKRYYDVRDLWPLLVQAGFLPSRIRCFKHKFGLNTFAVVQK